MQSRKLGDLIESVSITHKLKQKEVIFLNTSDVLNGNILSSNYSNVSDLKGQAKKTIKKDDILFSEIRPKNRRYAYVHLEDTEDYVVSTKLMVLRNKTEDVLTKYIYYFLTYEGTLNYLQMRAENRIGSFPQITFDILKPLSLKVPSFESQKKIVKLISSLDDKIKLNNRINAQLEQMAKTLYDYWFVQFDFPNAEGKPYMSSGGEMVYSEVLKREIPRGWEVSVFNDWIDRTKTGDWGKEDPEGNYTERVYCVRGADINGLNGKGEVKAPVRYILKSNLLKAVQPNDFIVEISGGSPVQSTGRIALLTAKSFQRFDAPVICSNFCKAVSLKDENYAFNFKQEWQRLYDAAVFFGYEGKTSGIKNFLFDSFMDSYHIVKPPKELAKKYYDKSQVLEKKKQINLQQNQQLAQLRDWLLPMLMNGQVTVGEAEEMVEELGKVAEEKGGYEINEKQEKNNNYKTKYKWKKVFNFKNGWMKSGRVWRQRNMKLRKIWSNWNMKSAVQPTHLTSKTNCAKYCGRLKKPRKSSTALIWKVSWT